MTSDKPWLTARKISKYQYKVGPAREQNIISKIGTFFASLFLLGGGLATATALFILGAFLSARMDEGGAIALLAMPVIGGVGLASLFVGGVLLAICGTAD
ncbi:MAG: hypothetical protein KI792_01105 [Alphaproteobacteria bacterium]|nr:hypothetical protein [Alphaproteobacteria bacterium SS10]